MKARTKGQKGRHLWPRLVQKIADGKTSYELSWKVKVMGGKKTKKTVCMIDTSCSVYLCNTKNTRGCEHKKCFRQRATQFSGRRSAWRRTTTQHITQDEHNPYMWIVARELTLHHGQPSDGSRTISTCRRTSTVLKHLISVDYEPIFSTTGRLVESAHANNTTLTPVSHQ